MKRIVQILSMIKTGNVVLKTKMAVLTIENKKDSMPKCCRANIIISLKRKANKITQLTTSSFSQP